MDRVAEAAPALALTTCVPAPWICPVRAVSWSWAKLKHLPLGSALRGQGHDGLRSMAANDRNFDLSWIQTFQFCSKSVGSNNVQGCHPKGFIGAI